MSDTPLANDTEAGVIRLATAAQEALTDSMVERLSIAGANTLEVVDRLNDEDTRDAVLKIIYRVTELNRSGGLDTVFDLLTLIHGAREAMTDNMLERLFIFIEHMVNNLATEDVADMVHIMQSAMKHAASESENTKTGGLLTTLGMLSKPQSQQALQFLLTFACDMRAQAIDKSKE
ncbi:MAG: hypothetical protein ISR52_04500 [Rhodospirillales bacterium]|nr:hypothetical protein [Rhodospirillales bacterium]